MLCVSPYIAQQTRMIIKTAYTFWWIFIIYNQLSAVDTILYMPMRGICLFFSSSAKLHLWLILQFAEYIGLPCAIHGH